MSSFLPMPALLAWCKDVAAVTVRSIRSGASNKLFLSRPIQFHLNNVTNLHQLTSQGTTACPIQHGYRIVTVDYCDVTSPCLLLK